MIRRKLSDDAQRNVLHPSRTAYRLLRDSKAVRPDLALKRQRPRALGTKLADSVYEVLG